MSEFFNKYYPSELKCSEPGSPYMDDYAYRVDDDGNKTLQCVGHTNLFEYIQSNKDYADINLMIERFISGDDFALERKHGFYGDIIGAPANIAEAISGYKMAMAMFEDLSDDVKSKFNFSAEEFWDSYGSEEFIAKFDDETNINVEKEMIYNEPSDNE